MTKTENQIAIIIVTYEAMQWYQDALQSIPPSKLKDVFIVDNASKDNSVQAIRQAFPDVTIIENDENLGFGIANNQGLKAALKNQSYTHFFLMNQDVQLQPNTLQTLSKIVDNSEDRNLLAPLQLNLSRNLHPGFRNYLPSEYVSNLVTGTVKDSYQKEFLPFGAILIPRKIIDTIGGFDPLFFLYSEDNDFCKRAIDAGFSIHLCPAARVIHNHSLSTKPTTFQKLVNRSYSLSVLKLKEKRHSFLYCLVRLTSQFFCSKQALFSPRLFLARLLGYTKALWKTGRIIATRKSDFCPLSTEDKHSHQLTS